MSKSSGKDDFDLTDLANRDALTGLHNLRYFRQALAEAVARAHRDNRPLALILFDIYHLGSINDRFGHVAGDELLVGVAERVREVVGSADIAARVGGDVFAIILSDSTLGGVKQFSARLNSQVAAKPYQAVGRITISRGVAELAVNEDSVALLHRADVALYEEKRGPPPPDEASGVRKPRRPKPSTGSEPVRRPLPDDQS